MKKNDFVYTGVENLEAMAEAKNYNAYLLKFVEDACKATGKKSPKVLDFGAGSGTYADMFKAKGVIMPDCLEPDADLQKVLSEKGYKTVSDSAKLKPESYDVIYALNVLEHIEDDGEIIKQLSRALKPGGKLVVYVPAFQVLFSTMDKRVGHFRRYKKDRLSNFAKQSDVRIKQLHYCDPIGFFASLVFRFVGSKDGVISAKSVRFYDRFAFPVSRILEPATRSVIGKNVVLVAEK